jgi:hypothetical protein
VVEVNPILAPVVAICDQLELLPSQRMVWVDDFKSGIAMVVMRCSRRPSPTEWPSAGLGVAAARCWIM